MLKVLIINIRQKQGVKGIRSRKKKRKFLLFEDNMIVYIVMEKAMAPHSSTLAWKIPWMEEPVRLQSMGWLSQTRLSDFTFTFHFHALEKEMAATLVFLPGESQGRGSLVGCHLWGCTDSDMTEAT